MTVVDSRQNPIEITNDKFTMPADSVVVSAEFVPVEYDITVVQPKHGELFTNPAIKAKDGSEVTITYTPDVGWELDHFDVKDESGKSVAVSGNKFVMPESKVTVYAVEAQRLQHEVAFDMQGHGSQIESQSVYDGQKATKPADPQEAGYTFDGWFKEAACENEFDFSSPITADTIIYAKWTAIPYSIETRMTEGVSSISVQVEGTEAEQATVGTTVDVSALPEITYEIQNITITPSDTTIDPIVITGDQGSFTMPASNVTITATAEHVAQHEVAFDMQGHGQQIASQEVYDGQTVTKPEDPQEPGYTFDGWFKEAACENEFDFSSPITADTTIYAKWTAIPYNIETQMTEGVSSISVQVEGTEAEQAIVGTTVDVSAMPDISYRILNITIIPDSEIIDPIIVPGDFASFEMPACNVTVIATAVDPTITHTVTFDSQGGTEVLSQTVAEGEYATEPAAPIRSGYNFNGWFTTPEAAGTAFDFEKTPIIGDMTLYANWIKIPSVPQVTGLNAKATDSKTASVTWNRVKSVDGIKYEVWRSAGASGDFKKFAEVVSNSYKDTKVITGTKYIYKVRAICTVSGKTYTGKFSKVDYAYPRLFQVTHFSAKALNAAKTQMAWNSNGNKNVSYQVYRSTKPTSGFKKVVTITNEKTGYTQNIMPDQSGKKYYYKVRAITKDYTGKWHYGAFSKVDYAYPRVATPTNFKAWASSKHTCNCSWSKVSGSNIKYLVYRSTKSTGNFRKVATTIKTSFTNTNMKSGQKYYYRVRAVQTINGKNYYSDYSIKDYAYPR